MDKISFIKVSYDELQTLPVKELESKIKEEIESYLKIIDGMNLEEKIKIREEVKNTRKTNFRFSQDKTRYISKDRIQIALTYLAKLFRTLDDQIKVTNQRNT